MKKLLNSKYEGVYVYQIVLAFICVVVVGTLLIYSINRVIDNDLFNENREIVLNRDEFDIITDILSQLKIFIL